MDKVFAAFTLATGCAASGMETTMFFTFWGLKAIQKGNLTGQGFFGCMVGVMNRGGIERVGPSRFGGVGRWMFKKMMRDKGVNPLSDLLQAAIDLEVEMRACKTSMDVMEIRREDLIDAVASIAGVASMLKDAAESQVQFFI